jgi:hypothetical protein
MRTNPSAHRARIATTLALLFLAVFSSTGLRAGNRKQTTTNFSGAPVIDQKGLHINYSRQAAAAQTKANRATSNRSSNLPADTTAPTASGFVTEAPATQPFWQYAIFGSGIGVSNIVVGPVPPGGGAPEILIGGNSTNNFGPDDFWQSIRHNAATGNYDQVFVSPIYSASVQRIAIAHVIDNPGQQIVVMLADGRIYLYDFTTKSELGYLNTGINGLTGLCLADLNGDGRAEVIVTTPNDLFVFDGSGNLLWQVAGAGGYDVVAGQMDNDPALEIATTSGNVVDASTHSVQWTRSGGFGSHLRLAPLAGQNYQQLVEAESWYYVYGYDIARQLPLWSIKTPQDIGAIQIADVDGDGVPEIIIGDNQWGTVHVHDLNTRVQKWAVNNPEHGVTNIAVADVDGDGTVDLLWGAGWTSTGPDYLYVANTNGAHAIKWQSVDLQGPFVGPAIGDLDGDGQPELVVCSYSSNSGYDSGRILVFDLATLSLRGISNPVVNDRAWTGVHDLKLRDVEGNGRMQIVIGADYLYDGAIEIYDFSASNTFTLNWTNATRPSGSPFNFVDVADLDGNGTRKIIGGNTVADTGSSGVYVYVYDYPSGTNSWRSVNMASGFNSVTGMVVQDLDGNGSKEIAALVGTGDFYTFDGPTRQLRNLTQSTGFTLLSNQATASGLVGGDSSGIAHFLQYGSDHYTEALVRQLSKTAFDGINVLLNDSLWTGSSGVLSLFLPPDYNVMAWQSPAVGSGFGRFAALDSRNGQARVFSSARQAVVGFALPDLTLTSAVSRKIHGAAGAFDIDLPLSGSVGVESRGDDGTLSLVFTFNSSVVTGSASVTSGTGGVSGVSFGGNTMTVNLTGVTNAQRITINLSGITDIFSRVLPDTSIVMGALLGDVNGSGRVDAADVSLVRQQTLQAVTSSNFREDINTSGRIDAADVSVVRQQTLTSLP